MTQKTNQNPWTFDVRVRERNLRAGSLTEKDLEKHLAGLPDLADQAEPFGTSQPALAQPPAPPAPVPAAAADEDFGDDEDDDDDLDDETNDAPEAAPAVDNGGSSGEGEPT